MTTTRRIDLSGQVFGRLTVVRFSHVDKHRAANWLCRCSCGQEKTVSSRGLRSGDTRSCWCLHAEVSGARFSKIMLRHGHSKTGQPVTREYQAWQNMIIRCENLKLPCRSRYGGRGISVCARWRNSFEAFFADMGPRPSPKHSLDRYPNNDGNYEPGNCRWATRAEQARNTSGNSYIQYAGDRLCESDWCARLGVSPGTVRRRLAMGWSVADAVTRPPREDSRRAHRRSAA